MNGEPLFPFAAGFITHPINDREKRVALTAAAAFIPGPLALAPALVAINRMKQEAAQPTAPRSNVGTGPRIAEVPHVEGFPEERAMLALRELGLQADIKRHESADDEKGVVLLQSPEAGTRIPVTRRVQLSIGAGLAQAPEQDKLDTFIQRVSTFMERTDANLSQLRADVDKLTPPQAGAAPESDPKSAKSK
jgi:hypothetical protein